MRKRRSPRRRSFGTHFYAPSPRFVAPIVRAQLRDAIGSLGQVVGVFVNAERALMRNISTRTVLIIYSFGAMKTTPLL